MSFDRRGAQPLLKRNVALKMMEGVEPGASVIVRNLNVFASPIDCAKTSAWCRARQIHFVVMGLGDLTDSKFAAIAEAFAAMERARKSERMLYSHAKRRAVAKRTSGSVPFGFTVAAGYLIEDTRQQHALSYMRQLRNEACSYRKIADKVSAEFQLSVSHTAVRRILKGKRKLNVRAIRQNTRRMTQQSQQHAAT